LKDVDFIDNAKREIARREINVWVEQKTNDKIKNLLGPGDLTSLTRLVLVKAIYFYGDWDNPFEKSASKPYEFNLADGTKITVPFMNRQDHYKYYEDSKIQAIEITYKDNKASMVIFLPAKQIPITDFEKVFDYQYYIEVVGSFKDSDVQLAVPKFRSTFKLNLNSILSEMGMPMAFSDNADFSGMTGKRDLYISEVIHQAFINVDEKGTEAAAATAGIMKITSAPNPAELKIFVADHPFIFCIKDNSSGTILFMGKVMDPRVPE
jgi:serpin B